MFSLTSPHTSAPTSGIKTKQHISLMFRRHAIKNLLEITCSTGRNTCNNKFAFFETNTFCRISHSPQQKPMFSVPNAARPPPHRPNVMPHVFNIVSNGERERDEAKVECKPTGTHARTAHRMCANYELSVSFLPHSAHIRFRLRIIVILLRDYVRHKYGITFYPMRCTETE